MFPGLKSNTMAGIRMIAVACFLHVVVFATDETQKSDQNSSSFPFPPSSYNKRERPLLLKGEALEVSLHIWVESFGSIDIAKMEFEIFGYIIERWKDERLRHRNHDNIILSGNSIGPLWVPDIYCINCRESNLDSGRNEKQSMMIISSDGSIYYSVGVKLVASCPINLINFPFDFQRCPIKLSSYSFNTSNLSFLWHSTPTVQNRALEQFDIVGLTTSVELQKYSSGYFTVLSASFGLSRRIGFYALQIYVPTIMLVCLSWSVFFMRTSTIGERITIGVTLFLAMVFLHGYSNASLPKVSYIKAVDWFIVVSLASILLIIIESILTDKFWGHPEGTINSDQNCNTSPTLAKRTCGKKSETEEDQSSNGHSNGGKRLLEIRIEEGDEEGENCCKLVEKVKCGSSRFYMKNLKANLPVCGTRMKSRQSFLQRVKNSKYDPIAITVFPLFYLVFNIWYWVYFTSVSKGH